MFRMLLLAGTAFVLGCSIVQAADIEPFVAYDWTGLYIGVHAGYASADTDYEFNDVGFFNQDPADVLSQDFDGIIGGGQIGANVQWDSLVLGLEGSFTWANLDETTISPFFPDTDEFTTRIDWVATITPRAGFAIDNVLLYAKGGIAFADIKARIEDNFSEEFVETKKTSTGWTVGGGAEYALTEGWIIGIEGNYYDFGSFDAGEESRNPDGEPTGHFSNHDVDTTMWSVLARIGYKL